MSAVIQIRRPDDETVEVSVDDTLVCVATHDEDGHEGMASLIDISRRLGKALGVEVTEC